MREIKFRAWDLNGKGFVNGFNMFGYSLGQGAPKRKLQRFNDEWNEGDFALMQYTGLKDKNGKEIYEGDVIDVKDEGFPFVKNWIGIVKFIEGSYLIENLEGTDGEYLFDELREIEVIGNIYENPELLEFLT